MRKLRIRCGRIFYVFRVPIRKKSHPFVHKLRQTWSLLDHKIGRRRKWKELNQKAEWWLKRNKMKSVLDLNIMIEYSWRLAQETVVSGTPKPIATKLLKLKSYKTTAVGWRITHKRATRWLLNDSLRQCWREITYIRSWLFEYAINRPELTRGASVSPLRVTWWFSNTSPIIVIYLSLNVNRQWWLLWRLWSSRIWFRVWLWINLLPPSSGYILSWILDARLLRNVVIHLPKKTAFHSRSP
jgi:hypothetical protein